MISPPPWGDSFFSHVAERATELETVQRLHFLRRKSKRAPVTEVERKSYFTRLQREGLAARVYLVWVNGLSHTQRRNLGLLHNGGFEIEPGNWGFDWHIPTGGSFQITRAYTLDTVDSKSLQFVLDRHQGHFEGPHQRLFLDTGTYRLDGRVHTESLDTEGELKWIVRCLRPKAETLGESERFLGANPWRNFGFEFPVANSCTLHRLVSAEKYPLEHVVMGRA